MLISSSLGNVRHLPPLASPVSRRHNSAREFFERMLGSTAPYPHAVWLRKHVAPERALRAARPSNLFWLTEQVHAALPRAERNAVLSACAVARLAYRKKCDAPLDTTAVVRCVENTELLRITLEATSWWTRLRHRWDFEQTRGIGTVAYTIGNGEGLAFVRGTRVGHFAVREVAVPFNPGYEHPPMRHNSRTPKHWANPVGPQHLYAIDVVADGLSVGAYTSPAIAFEIAHRFERAGVFTGPIPDRLRRLMLPYQGPPPPTSTPSWPAQPPVNFAARIPMRPILEEVRHAVG